MDFCYEERITEKMKYVQSSPREERSILIHVQRKVFTIKHFSPIDAKEAIIDE